MTDLDKTSTQDLTDVMTEAAETVNRQQIKQSWKRMIKSVLTSVWFWLLMLLPAGLLLRKVCRQNTGFAEFYWRYIYRYLSVFWNNVTGVLPFSIGEFLLLLTCAGLLVYLISVTVGVIRHKGKRLKTLLKGILRLMGTASAVFFLYITNCGLNYYCPDFMTLQNWSFEAPDKEELYELCVYLSDNASLHRKKLPETPEGTVAADIRETAEKAKNAVNALHGEYECIFDGYSNPKSVLLSEGMSWLNISGVYFPWTFEANVNTDFRGYQMAFTMCHELSHVRGFMHEEDANFIAYLACISCEDDLMAYSGYAYALRYVSGYLYRTDEELYRDCLKHLDEGVLRDMAAESLYWKKYETPVAEAAVRINNSYLKTNNQAQGVRSYSKMAELVIEHYRRHIRPEMSANQQAD